MYLDFIHDMSLSSMSHVDFKKTPCRCVEFKGQGPPKYFAHLPLGFSYVPPCPMMHLAGAISGGLRAGVPGGRTSRQ